MMNEKIFNFNKLTLLKTIQIGVLFLPLQVFAQSAQSPMQNPSQILTDYSVSLKVSDFKGIEGIPRTRKLLRFWEDDYSMLLFSVCSKTEIAQLKKGPLFRATEVQGYFPAKDTEKLVKELQYRPNSCTTLSTQPKITNPKVEPIRRNLTRFLEDTLSIQGEFSLVNLYKQYIEKNSSKNLHEAVLVVSFLHKYEWFTATRISPLGYTTVDLFSLPE